MDDNYSDDELPYSSRAKSDGEDETAQDLRPAASIDALPSLNDDYQPDIAPGEAFSRADILYLFGAATNSSKRHVSAPAQVRQFGETFGSLAGALVASRHTPVVLELCDGQQKEGSIQVIRRDMSLTLEDSRSWLLERSSASAAAAQPSSTSFPSTHIASIRIPEGVHLSSNISRYIKANLPEGKKLVTGKRKRSNARGAAAEHAPVGLLGFGVGDS